MMEEQNQQTLSPQQPTVPPQNVNPVPPPQQRSWIKWVLIIVLVALLSSGATYLVLNSQTPKQPPPQIVQTIPSPTPDLYTEATRSATANWKTYTSSLYGFLLKYPEYWTYGVRGQNSQIAFDTPTHIEQADGLVAGKVTLEIIPSSSQALTIDDAIKKVLVTVRSIKKSNVGNLEVAEVHHEACPTNNDCITLIFIHDDNIFQFHSNADSERYENLPIMYQILSTFRFTNP